MLRKTHLISCHIWQPDSVSGQTFNTVPETRVDLQAKQHLHVPAQDHGPNMLISVQTQKVLVFAPKTS